MSADPSRATACGESTDGYAGTITVSIGIFAHNEERLIARVLEAFLTQRLEAVRVAEVIVDASGSNDRTVRIASALAARHPIVRVRCGRKREGKAQAINEFLKVAVGDALIIAAGDTVPGPNVVEALARALVDDPGCGMAGGRPIPRAARESFVTRMNGTLWELHHAVALRSPKLGEVVAVRRGLVSQLPGAVFCDEVALEALVRGQGQRLAYVPVARVENFSPTTLLELYRQRRRINCQHLAAVRTLGYAPSTFRLLDVVPEVVPYLRSRPREAIYLGALGLLEVVARLHGRLDHRRGHRYPSWAPVHRPSLDQHESPAPAPLDAAPGELVRS